MPIPEKFSRTPYVTTKQREHVDIGTLLREKRLQQWLETPGQSLPAVERVFIISGWPGCGKTRFLHAVADWPSPRGWRILGAAPKRYTVVYLDLEERLSPRFRTPQAFVVQTQAEIAQKQAESKAICLCVDHVPSRADDETLTVVEQQLLLPLLEEGAFLILVQQHPRRWALGGKLPHPSPWPLEVFREEGLRGLLANYRGDQMQEALFHARGHPLLALWICERGVEEGMCQFLTYWISRRGMASQQKRLFRYACPLAKTSPEDEKEGKRLLEAAGIPAREWRQASLLLQDVGWWEPFRRLGDGRYEARQIWVSPIQHCLFYLSEHSAKPCSYAAIGMA